MFSPGIFAWMAGAVGPGARAFVVAAAFDEVTASVAADPDIIDNGVLVAAFDEVTASATVEPDITAHGVLVAAFDEITASAAVAPYWEPDVVPGLLQWTEIDAASLSGSFATPAISNAGYNRVTGIPSSGGSLAASWTTPTNDPSWVAGKSGLGRICFINNSDYCQSSIAASNYRRLHYMTGQSFTVGGTFHARNMGVDRYILNTKTTPGNGVDVGASLICFTNGIFTYNYGIGADSQSFSSSTGVIIKNHHYEYIVTGESGGVEVLLRDATVNGAWTSVASGVLTKTQVNSDSGVTLQWGRSCNGHASPPILYDSVLTGANLDNLKARLAEYTAPYVDLADFAANEPHNATGIRHWGSGGIVTITGATASAIGSPSNAQYAAINNEYAGGFDGSTTAFAINADAAGTSGDDKPSGGWALLNPNNTAATKSWLSYEQSGDTGWFLCYFSSAEVSRYWLESEAATTAFHTANSGSPVDTWQTAGVENLGTGGWISYLESSAGSYTNALDGAVNVSTKGTLDTATIGASRQNSVLAGVWSGEIAAIVNWSGASPNPAMIYLLDQMAYHKYGVI